MNQNSWQIRPESGFLMSPDPLVDLSTVETPLANEITGQLQDLADRLLELIQTRQIRPELVALPVHDLTPLGEVAEFRIHERAFQIYAHLANAYVWSEVDNPSDHLPAGVAVPLVLLSKLVQRPPIVSYAGTALSNFRRLDPAGGFVVDNLVCVQKLVDIPDESWFHLTHVEIEAHAGTAIQACLTAVEAAKRDDLAGVRASLAGIPPTLDRMVATFKRITYGCSPDVYYHTLRPYLFGFDDIVYEGVQEYGGKPQTFVGETGAQSTVIPALQRFLGLSHERGGLTEHLQIMKGCMPKPHRDLIASIDQSAIRDFVHQQQHSELKDIYNACLEGLVTFRSLHLHMAQAYVAQKVEDPRGTGGTDFMHWLKQLRDETAQQLIK